MFGTQAQVDAAVQELKSFKAAYKAAAGKEWSPAAATSPVAPSPVQKSLSTPDVNTLNSQIKVAGDKVRDLKTKKAAKVILFIFCILITAFNSSFFFFSD